ncbi:hypothetical protein [Mucilaginibacter humi]|uniref:hypothetical protein n=1 Tax=Mucilaginibacter humi TaxID=2732510 RepID=UPI001FEC9338|nr:hypothetical protein [Mucilaginibacter humi]
MSMIGAVSSYRDSKAQFYSDHYGIHKANKINNHAVVIEGVEAFEMQDKILVAEAV